MVTVAQDAVKCWKIASDQTATIELIIPAADEPTNLEKKPIACISNKGDLVVVNRGELMFTVYEVKSNQVKKVKTIDLLK